MALNIAADIVMVQKLFIGNQEIYHSKFSFYWLPKKKKELKIMTAIGKNLENKSMVNHKKKTRFFRREYND